MSEVSWRATISQAFLVASLALAGNTTLAYVFATIFAAVHVMLGIMELRSRR